MNNITINNSNVTINNVPQKQRNYRRCFRFGKLRFYITYNLRLKNSQARDNTTHETDTEFIKAKRVIKTRADNHCEICGCKSTHKYKGEIHHILPYCKFPQLKDDPDNLLYLCKKCHREIHNNPYKNISLMEQKAMEYGINLKDYYEV